MSNNDQIQNIFLILQQFEVNPYLLTCICSYAYNLLSNPKVRKDHLMLRFLINQMVRLITILPILGGKKYDIYCRLSEMYYPNTFIQGRAIDRKQNNNPIMHNLQIIIMKIIRYFSVLQNLGPIDENGNKNLIYPIIKELTTFLNENQRELYLFYQMEFPSEVVRKAAIDCLIEIPLDEWEYEEAVYMVDNIKQLKFQISEGSNEFLIANLFFILSKFVDNLQLPLTKEYLKKLANISINDCLEILMRNMERNLSHNQFEEQQKIDLSMSLIFFLKKLSAVPQLETMFKGSSVLLAFKSSLKYEQMYMKQSFFSIDIEKTSIGRNLAYLLQLLSGNDSLAEIYHIVSYRVLLRIADILTGIANEDLPYLGKIGFDIKLLNLKIGLTLANNIKIEKDLWTKLNYSKLTSNKAQLDKLIQDQEVAQSYFTNQNGIEYLINFMQAKTNNPIHQNLENQIQKEYGNYFSLNMIKQNILHALPKIEKDFQVMLNDQLESKKTNQYDQIQGAKLLQTAFFNVNTFKEATLLNKDKLILQPPLFLVKFYKLEQYIEEQKIQLNKKKSVLLFANNDDDDDDINEEDEIKQEIKKISEKLLQSQDQLNLFRIEGDSVKENQQRDHNLYCIQLAACLRAINSCLEYNVKESFKIQAIQQLRKKKFFMMLAQCVSASGYMQASIGVKYLKIVQEVIRLNIDKEFEDFEMIEQYEIVGKAQAQILEILSKRLNEENQSLKYQ